MIYPKFIKDNSTIGVVAPSDGIVKASDIEKLDKAIDSLSKLGFSVVEAPSVRKSVLGRSASPRVRAKELEDMFKNKEIDEISDALGIFSNKAKMREVFENAVKFKPLKNGEVNVIFGDELDMRGLENYSFVYSMYNFDGSPGIIGVVGPKRMAYSKTIGVIKHITEEVNKAIKLIGCKGE